MTIPILIPAEYDDSDTDTNINAGRDANHSTNFRRKWKLSDVLLSRTLLEPSRLAGYAASKCVTVRLFRKNSTSYWSDCVIIKTPSHNTNIDM